PEPREYYFPLEANASKVEGNAWGSPFFHIFPYLEQSALYQSTYGPVPPNNLNRFYGKKCDNSPVKLYICPSDIWNTAFEEKKALGSYVVNSLAFGDVDEFAEGGNQIADSFAKGVSQTILYTEHYAKCRDGKVDPPKVGPEVKDMLWNREQARLRVYLLFQVRPLYDPVPEGTDPERACMWYRAQTPHWGGINACLVDGSVRFISAGIKGKPLKDSTWYWAMQPDSPKPPPSDW